MPDDTQAFSGTSGDAAAFTAPPDPRARLEELLASEFVTQAHVDPSQAQLQAKWLVDSTAISARIASHALPADRLTAFKNLFAERALEESFAEMPTPTAKAAAHDILMAENNYDYRSLYQAAQDVPLPPLSQPNELHPFVSYVFETGSAKFKNEAGKFATRKFFESPAGQEVTKHATKVLGKEAVKKLLTQAGVKAATTAATAGGGAAAGAEAGAAAGSPGGPLAIVTAIVGAVVGFVLGAVVGNWSKVKHEAQEGILATFALGATLFQSAFTFTVGAFNAVLGAIGAVAVESAGTIVVIVLAIPIVIAFMLYIITNSAYLVPPSFGSIVGTGPGGIPPTLPECQGSGPPKPGSASILLSSDGRYAYPVGYPINSLWYGCTHWNGQIATDIGFVGYSSPPPQSPAVHAPVLAYTSGIITYTSLNDVLGGKNIILKGDDGRYYYYAHNCGLYVNRGDRVSVGDIIATTDNTGEAATTVEHLHFGISNYNTFYGGGTICPATDFQQKFSLTRCQGQPQCR